MIPTRHLVFALLGPVACITRDGAPDKPPDDSSAVVTVDTADTATSSTHDSDTTVVAPPCVPITDGPVWTQDKDGDCLDASLDCDDLDPDVNNGDEVCDGKDNDCDGGIDERALLTWHTDADGDGYAGTVVEACSMPAPWLSTDYLGTDCDDADATTHPEEPGGGAVTGIDLPGDGIDQDCDGQDACGPVCVGYDCGFSTTAEAEAFCDTWAQAARLEVGFPGPDLSEVDCLCTPPVELVIYVGEGSEPSLAGLENWFPTEVLQIEDSTSGPFTFPGLEGVQDIPVPIRIWCRGDDYNSFDVHFDGLADVERLGGLELVDYYGYGCYTTDTAEDLSGLESLQVIDGDLLLHDTQIQTLRGLEALVEVGGSVDIDHCKDLSDISALAELRTVGGGLDFNQQFNDLKSLEGLVSVGGDLGLRGPSLPEFPNLRQLGGLSLADMDTLDLSQFLWVRAFSGGLLVARSDIHSFAGLDNLGSVQAGVWISDNPSLSSLEGLGALTSISSDLHLGENPTLTTLSGLSALTIVGGDVEITDNDALTTLDGLSALTDVSGGVLLEGNATLTLDTAIPLARVGGTVEMVDNPALTALDSLASLTSIAGSLEITNNDQLTSLAGLYGLQSVGGDVRFEGNALLTETEIYAFLDHLGRDNIGLKVVVER